MVMESTNQEVIYQGNSIISVEILSDYAHPVVLKKPFKRHPSRRSLRSLENEYQMARSLNAVEARSGLETEFNQTAVRPLPPATEAELYAVAREALNNTLKHAGAKQVTVSLAFDEQGCCLTIADDGIGFDLEAAKQGAGYGLRGMRERVDSINGKLTLETSPGEGTIVRVQVAA